MSEPTIYSSYHWRQLSRDHTCSVADLLGGECAGPIHLHHIHPLSEGGDPYGDLAPVCARHHAVLHATRRRMSQLDDPEPPRCRHVHRYPGAREECERRMRRRLEEAA